MSAYKPIKDCETVAELLEDPARWCQTWDALDYLDACGRAIVAPWCKSAEKFSVSGAIKRLNRLHGKNSTDMRDSFRKAVGKRSWKMAKAWHDDPSRTHAEVLAAVRKAGI